MISIAYSRDRACLYNSTRETPQATTQSNIHIMAKRTREKTTEQPPLQKTYTPLPRHKQVTFGSRRKIATPSTVPQTSRRTRQQTLTQIDFVTRLLPDELDEFDDDDDEALHSKSKKRRRTDGPEDHRRFVTEEDAGQMKGVRKTDADAAGDSQHNYGVSKANSMLLTPKKKTVKLEVPSSQSPSEPSSAKRLKRRFRTPVSPLHENSTNIQIAPRSLRRVRTKHGLKPKLEIKSTIAEENEYSQLSQALVFPTSHHRDSLLRPDDGTRSSAVMGQRQNHEIAVRKDVCDFKEARINAPSRSKEKRLEIQDSEADPDDEDLDLEGEKKVEPDDQTQVDEADLPSPTRIMQREGSGEECDYSIGLETQAVIDKLDLSSDGLDLPVPQVSFQPTVNGPEAAAPKFSKQSRSSPQADVGLGLVTLSTSEQSGSGENRGSLKPRVPVQKPEQSTLELPSSSTESDVEAIQQRSADDQIIWEASVQQIPLLSSSPAANYGHTRHKDASAHFSQSCTPTRRPIPSISQATTVGTMSSIPPDAHEQDRSSSLPPLPQTPTLGEQKIAGDLQDAMCYEPRHCGFVGTSQLLPESLLNSFLPPPPALSQESTDAEE